MTTPQHQSEDEDQGTDMMEVTGPSSAVRGCQEGATDTNMGYQPATAAQDTTPIITSGDLVVAPDTYQNLAAWPWLSSELRGTHYSMVQELQGFGFPANQWPNPGTPFRRVMSPYPQVTSPAPLGATTGVGVWPYPSVPDTGCNSVHLKSLPLGGLHHAIRHGAGSSTPPALLGLQFQRHMFM